MGKMTGETREITYPGEEFRDVLELDKETGSLFIKNTTIKHTGDFKVKISNWRRSTKTKMFCIKFKAETKCVQEGDSVTLEPDTEIESDDEIQWMFGDKDDIIAKMGKMTGVTRDITYTDEGFRDRLDLDQETGSLTIKNITIKHTGDFKMKIISSSRRTTEVKMFCIKVNDERVTVMKGDTAILKSAAEIKSDDKVQYSFEYNKSPIAEIKDGQEISTSDGPDKMFRNRLELDKKTGSLTIKNIKREHAGFYYLKVTSSSSVCEKRYDVFVVDEPINVMEGTSFVLESAAEIQRDKDIEWRFSTDKSPIAEIKDGQISTSAHDEMFKDTLDLDKKTGSLTIRNIRREHAGFYQFIIRNRCSTFFPFFNAETVTFMEGKTAVLKTSAEIQTDDQIEWRFNTDESPIAGKKTGQIFLYAGAEEIFKDRLELDEQTGFLTIKNISHEHAGIYQLKIMNSSSAAYVKTFTVIVDDENESRRIFPEWLLGRRCIGRVLEEETGLSTAGNIRREHDEIYQLRTMNSSSAALVKTFYICVKEERVTFVEGDTAVLKSAAEIQNHDQIEWRFNYDNPIAEIKTGQIFPYAGPDGIFKDRLELDEQTGFLTIRKIRREHAGVYQLKIMNSSSAIHVKTLTVIVNEEKVRVKEGRRAVLESAAEIQKDDHVEWRFEYKKSPIAEIKDGQISTSDGPGGRFRDALDLDKKTGSLTIRNVRCEHAGFYLLKVKKSNSAVHEKRFTVSFVVSKRQQVKNLAVEKAQLLHEETPLLHEDDVIYENERMSSL
ncbi:uncharacterized protein LOC130215475 [Danio aesculapii]|uniref:uncharacterized protein LOC130215475 n=1 Tax=Danio aesculapii TaxID=1142201 RepID=UPI0024C053B4|nr:uncharacterized protein LOC130215475 [Danio aesculapii]